MKPIDPSLLAHVTGGDNAFTLVDISIFRPVPNPWLGSLDLNVVFKPQPDPWRGATSIYGH